MKEKLQTLVTEFTKLKEKILAKLQLKEQTISQTNTKLSESTRKLELQAKESSENEKVLAQLLTEFKELAKFLE